MATIPPVTAQSSDPAAATGSTGYRPGVWNQPALTVLQTTQSSTQVTDQGVGTQTSRTTTIYVFDAVFRLDHFSRIKKTEHPVQSGANITDHAYIMPGEVVMEIGMSDVMDSFTSGMWTGTSQSKSVNAFQMLVKLQQSRVPITLTTRLMTYQNMVVDSVEPKDDFKTRHSLRATVRMSQIFMASVQVTGQSNDPQTTNSTEMGSSQPGTVPDGVTNQNIVEPGSGLLPGTTVPGSNSPTGAASSNNVADDPVGS